MAADRSDAVRHEQRQQVRLRHVLQTHVHVGQARYQPAPRAVLPHGARWHGHAIRRADRQDASRRAQAPAAAAARAAVRYRNDAYAPNRKSGRLRLRACRVRTARGPPRARQRADGVGGWARGRAKGTSLRRGRQYPHACSPRNRAGASPSVSQDVVFVTRPARPIPEPRLLLMGGLSRFGPTECLSVHARYRVRTSTPRFSSRISTTSSAHSG